MSAADFSEEELNAFIDGELNAADQARILEAIGRNEALQQRVAEYQRTQQLLRHAYEHPPQPHARRAVTPSRAWQALAATLLLCIGVGSGWLLHGVAIKQFAAQTTKGVVIQVSEADPAKWEMALINARNVRKAYGDKPMAVEIVAYGPGLKMFHHNSRVATELEAARKSGVKLLACGNTMSMTHTTRDELNRAVDVVPAGIVEIMERQQDGYAYIRP
ncbi:MAG: DsrE family protein [Burkholderiales bacterium]|nr:DsrE family protein [Burkholderiales bacterium]